MDDGFLLHTNTDCNGVFFDWKMDSNRVENGFADCESECAEDLHD